jgi:hypothetical protein
MDRNLKARHDFQGRVTREEIFAVADSFRLGQCPLSFFFTDTHALTVF